MVAVAPPVDFFPQLHDAAGGFVLQLMATANQLAQQLNARADQIENNMKELYKVVDSKANQTELDALIVKVKSQETGALVEEQGRIAKAHTEFQTESSSRVEQLELEAKRLSDLLDKKSISTGHVAGHCRHHGSRCHESG